MEKNQRPVKFNRWNKLWESWHTWLKENQISAIQACLQFALSYSQIDRVVVGVDSLKQLEQLLKLSKKDIGVIKRLYILPLKFWQMKSYNDFRLNCQFYPSCSNHCAISIYKEGIIIGSIKGMDRYFRCNNSI